MDTMELWNETLSKISVMNSSYSNKMNRPRCLDEMVRKLRKIESHIWVTFKRWVSSDQCAMLLCVTGKGLKWSECKNEPHSQRAYWAEYSDMFNKHIQRVDSTDILNRSSSLTVHTCVQSTVYKVCTICRAIRFSNTPQDCRKLTE